MPRKFTFTTQVYDKKTDFPATGDVDVIYIDASKNLAYRYDDSYYSISSAEVDIWGAMGSLSKGGGGGGGASWGDITGTLSDQTDLQTALDGKQDDLTLTTTGTSGAATLSGATLNIPQYGGGVGIHALVKPVSGRRISYGLTTASVTGSNFNVSRLQLVPFIPANTFTISDILMFSNIAVSGSLCRLLIYSDNNGLPNAKLYESANLDLSTTGFKIATTTFTFNAGTTYWLAFHGNATTSNVIHYQVGSIYQFANSGTSVQPANSYFISATLGSAPANITSPTLGTGSVPWIAVTPA